MTDEKDSKKKKTTIGKTIGTVAKKGIKTGIDVGVATGKIIKEAVEEKLNEDELESKSQTKAVDAMSVKKPKKKKKDRPFSNPVRSFSDGVDNMGKNLEVHVTNWYRFFFSMFIYLLVIVVSSLISNIDPNFSVLIIVVVAFFPIFFVLSLKMAMPGFSISQFIRRSYQVSRGFVKEMIRISPTGSFILFMFLLILLYVSINAIVGLVNPPA